MTARTIPFWQQILSGKLESIADAQSLHDLNWHRYRSLSFIDGVWAAGAIGEVEQTELRASITATSDKRRAILKQQGVKA